MSSSSEEELGQPRYFEERRLFDIENLREFRSFVSLWTPSFTFWNFTVNRSTDFERAAAILKFAFVKIHVHSNHFS